MVNTTKWKNTRLAIGGGGPISGSASSAAAAAVGLPDMSDDEVLPTLVVFVDELRTELGLAENADLAAIKKAIQKLAPAKPTPASLSAREVAMCNELKISPDEYAKRKAR